MPTTIGWVTSHRTRTVNVDVYLRESFDVGEVEELPYLAMEYCAGGTLAKRLDGKPILPKLAAKLIRQICAGVAAAHERRIIHRDLKPKNILLERESDWSPKVSDFGLAKLLDSDATATATGNLLGTPTYMSPEQAFGDTKRVGPAADVYSLGAILYECLTGRPPFLGVTIADTLEQVRQREPVPVRQLEPHVPLDLETILQKCMRKEPQQRYSTVAELQDDLSRFLNRQPILARRERWHEATARLARKYPVVIGLTTVSVMLLLGVTLVSVVFAKTIMDANVRIRKSEVAAKLGQASALVSGWTYFNSATCGSSRASNAATARHDQHAVFC
jgi:eukaryotic-like serine/threonine-protein kinase